MRVVISLLAAAFAVALPTKTITTIAVEALHKGSRMEVANFTIIVPVGPAYVNKALRAVSALYVLDNDAISCIPYHSDRAFGSQSVYFQTISYISPIFYYMLYAYECPRSILRRNRLLDINAHFLTMISNSGNPFTFGHPARLSENTTVGSIVCTKN
ncbi:hypothetical protein F4860DRAFT_456160 [Xylaria cubensis]|nr:hypothetical protein F4860DRAFT_456160 [Xylaria cubensis]